MSNIFRIFAMMKKVGLLRDKKFITKLNRIFKNKVMEFGDKNSLYARGHLRWGLKYDGVYKEHSLNITLVIHECTWTYKPFSWEREYPSRTHTIMKGNHNRARVRNNFEGPLRNIAHQHMKLWGAERLDIKVSLSFPSRPPVSHEPNSKESSL